MADKTALTDAPTADAKEKTETEEKPKAKTKARKKPETKTEEKTKPKAEEKPKPKAKEKTETEEKPKAEEEPKTKEEQKPETKAEEKAEDKPDSKAEEKPKPEAKEKTEEKPEAKAEEKTGEKTETEAQEKPEAETENQTDQSKEPTEGEVSETIKKMTQSPATLPGESAPPPTAQSRTPDSTNATSAVRAIDIMQKNLAWANPDDNVQQALVKMEQTGLSYMMVGTDGALEGIVSNFDLSGAVSPYLRPAFAKWRRPLDDATLQIRVKWIMTKPVHTVKSDASITAVMENMCRLNRNALPVLDQQGKVLGLVTVFDVFKTLLNSN